MSNKGLNQLMPLDREARAMFPAGPGLMTQTSNPIIITMLTGFELFNDRPYHNYETFSDGWQIETPLLGGIKVRAEDLDDAWREFKRKVAEAKK
jgi:hypothetical protein